MNSGHLPTRQKLPHAVPPWVEQGARHFITIRCEQRNINSLCHAEIAIPLIEAAKHYERLKHWYLWQIVVMPDHIHLIATFDLDRGMRKTISEWKRYLSRTLNIAWQQDFFEHRLRDQAAFKEKMSYVRTNPLKQGLATDPELWPYSWERSTLLEDGSLGTARPTQPRVHTDDKAKRSLPASRITRTNAFTLIELMAVLIIVGVLIGLVFGMSGYASRAARKGKAVGQLEDISNALEDYLTDAGVYPDSLRGITNRLPASFKFDSMSGLPLDPWNRTYTYATNSPYAFSLLSYGPDGTNGASDTYIILGKQ